MDISSVLLRLSTSITVHSPSKQTLAACCEPSSITDSTPNSYSSYQYLVVFMNAFFCILFSFLRILATFLLSLKINGPSPIFIMTSLLPHSLQGSIMRPISISVSHTHFPQYGQCNSSNSLSKQAVTFIFAIAFSPNNSFTLPN